MEIGCRAHARRKLEELHQNQRSDIAAGALLYYGLLYDVETEAREQQLDAMARQRLRAEHARPVAWLFAGSLRAGQRAAAVPDRSADKWCRMADIWPIN
ncbi:MAG: IS66 family transposase [Steroidobacteraceae bacterium]